MRLVSPVALLVLATSGRPALTQVAAPREAPAVMTQSRAAQDMRIESSGPNLVMITWSPGSGGQRLRLESSGFTVRHEADGTTVRSMGPVTMTGTSSDAVRTFVWQDGMTMVVGQNGALKWVTSSPTSR